MGGCGLGVAGVEVWGGGGGGVGWRVGRGLGAGGGVGWWRGGALAREGVCCGWRAMTHLEVVLVGLGCPLGSVWISIDVAVARN